MKKFLKCLFGAVALVALFFCAAGVGGVAWFELSDSTKSCAKCHELKASRESWAHSVHKDVSCKECHGRSCCSVEEARANAKRLYSHLTKRVRHEEMRLDAGQVARMSVACGKCHAKEYAQWSRSGHGRDYERYFLDNRYYTAFGKPADQCLRCHGMFYGGTIGELLQRSGNAWAFVDGGVAHERAIPCLACHSGHNEKSAVGFYSRPDGIFFAAADLTYIPAQTNGVALPAPTDTAGRVCVQCHAPNARADAGSGDDMSLMGKHTGLSCLACHGPHDAKEEAKKSCALCHIGEKAQVREGWKAHRRND